MPTRSERGLFGALEQELRKSKEPLDCATLFEVSAVREHAATVNRVSDYLGNMWRKGLVLRVPAPKIEGTRARWLYVWKGKKKEKPDMSKAFGYEPQLETLLARPHLEVTEEDGTVVITMPAITITIKPNR